jgi:hypothetical protein
LKFSASLIELFAISLLILVAIVLSDLYQKQISYHDGKGWDGVEYCRMAEQIAANQPVSARAPFVYRIGTSFLAAKLFPYNLNYGFKILNISAGVIGIYLLWFWLTLFVPNKVLRTLLTASYIFYWQAPLRLSFYYPYHADPIALVFLFAGLILLKYLINSYSIKKIIYFSAVTLTGVFFREICLIPALILFITKLIDSIKTPFDRNSLKKKAIFVFQSLYSRFPMISNEYRIKLNFTYAIYLTKKLFIKNVYFIPLFIGTTGIIITHFFVNQNNNYSFFKSAIYWIYAKSILMYFHAWFLSIGIIFIVVLYYFSDNIEFFKKNKYLFFYLIVIIFISIAGGSDTERLIMWSIPVIYVLISNIISKYSNVFKSPILLIIMVLTQIVSIRAFLLIPDYPDDDSFQIPFLTPISNHFPLFNLWTIHGDEKILLISFAEYVTLALFLSYLFWGKDKTRKTF